MTLSLKSVNPAIDFAAPALLEKLIQKAQTAGASDIHLHQTCGGTNVAFRLDGVLNPSETIAGELADRVLGRIKFLARLKTYQSSLPQDGRIERTAVNAATDIRVSTYPTISGEKIVLRLFNQSAVRSVAELGLPPDARNELNTFLKQAGGLLLITGPAGSGKTTTIYACLRDLAAGGTRHIITIEDPVEQILPGIMQTEVNEAQGLDFARAARHLLRQDPQVLVLGEIRDESTANIAIRAALTGHMVITTLHAGSCKGVFERLSALCPDRSALASSVELVINQRLVRAICQKCSGEDTACAECFHTGYKGRIPLIEFYKPRPNDRRAIATGAFDAVQVGESLQQRAQILIQNGMTNASEIARVMGYPM